MGTFSFSFFAPYTPNYYCINGLRLVDSRTSQTPPSLFTQCFFLLPDNFNITHGFLPQNCFSRVHAFYYSHFCPLQNWTLVAGLFAHASVYWNMLLFSLLFGVMEAAFHEHTLACSCFLWTSLSKHALFNCFSLAPADSPLLKHTAHPSIKHTYLDSKLARSLDKPIHFGTMCAPALFNWALACSVPLLAATHCFLWSIAFRSCPFSATASAHTCAKPIAPVLWNVSSSLSHSLRAFSSIPWHL